MKELRERYESAAAYLPIGIRKTALLLPGEQKEKAEEFRLRCGRPAGVVIAGKEYTLDQGIRGENTDLKKVVSSDLQTIIDIATQLSAHTAAESIKNGYITVPDGHRIGLCGTAVIKNGEVTGIKKLSSVCIRISKEIRGAANVCKKELVSGGRFISTLIISPPGAGKTTLIRDLVRILSSGEKNPLIYSHKVAVADERDEICAMYNGTAQYETGPNTDVISSCPKHIAAMMLLRSMSPEVIVMDEITAAKDVEAIEMIANCGVKLLASAHASGIEELQARPLYRRILELGVFKRAAVLKFDGIKRGCEVREL